jgi:hypothetical protein
MLDHLIAVSRRRDPSVVGVLPAQSKPAFHGNGSLTLDIWLPLRYRVGDESACGDCLHIALLPPNADPSMPIEPGT